MRMKKILVLAVFAVLGASLSGCATRGSLFNAGSGERILETAVAGTVVGAGVGVLAEIFGGGDRDRDVVVARNGHGNGGGWYGGGCRSCGYEYDRQYNSWYAAGESARRNDHFQRQEESRRLDEIRSERAGNRGRLDGFEDGRRHRGRR